MLKARGFTVIELLIAVAVIAILSTLAWPSYQSAIQRARRADGQAALARVQQAQERRRSQQPTYAAAIGSGGLGLPTSSPDGHYTVATSTAEDSAATAYRVSASASGAQASDTACRHLAIDVNAGSIALRSGPTSEYANGSDINRRCWNR